MHGGRRLLIVAVDGREFGGSAGMSLPELARYLVDAGAEDAINLDGGGSTAMVIPALPGPPRHAYVVANHPSDQEGERAVSDALVIVNACGP
jgi:exopolysaccharide biosynthesis protein